MKCHLVSLINYVRQIHESVYLSHVQKCPNIQKCYIEFT